MTPSEAPSHDLETAKSLLRLRRYKVVNMQVVSDLMKLGMDEVDLVNCVLGLTPSDFHKTMESTRRPGTMLDVYRPYLGKTRIYLKFYLSSDKELVLLLSFKGDTSR